MRTPTAAPLTNWNAYTHEELYAMVHDGADPGQVGQQSHSVGLLAGAARDTADRLSRHYGRVGAVWQGTASEHAAGTIGKHHDGGLAMAAAISSVSRALDLAATALDRAQRAMPEPVRAGGRLPAARGRGRAAALAAVLHASGGGFGRAAVEAERRNQAVRVMRAYENELRAASHEVKRLDAEQLPPGLVARAATERTVPRPGQAQVTEFGWLPSTAPPADPPPATTPAASGPSVTRSSASADLGPDGRTLGSPTSWRELTGNGTVPGLPRAFRDDAARSASAPRSVAAGHLGAMPGMVPPGAAGLSGGAGGERPHTIRYPLARRRLDFGEPKASPPVIGSGDVPR